MAQDLGSEMQVVADSAPAPSRRGRRNMTSWLNRYALVLIWIALAVVLSIASPDRFLQPITFSTIFGTQSVLVILTLALLLPLSVGDFDLSVANMMGMSATLMVVLNGDKFGLPLWVAMLAAISAGLLVGAFNAYLVVKVGVDSIVTTLGMATLLLGLSNWVSGSIIQTGISELLSNAVNERLLGLPLSFWYAMVLAGLLSFIMSFRPLGRRIAFVGQNREMARLSGVRVDRIRFFRIHGCGTSRVPGGHHDGGSARSFPGELCYVVPATDICGSLFGHDCRYSRPFQSLGVGCRDLLLDNRDHRLEPSRVDRVDSRCVLRGGAHHRCHAFHPG